MKDLTKKEVVSEWKNINRISSISQNYKFDRKQITTWKSWTRKIKKYEIL